MEKIRRKLIIIVLTPIALITSSVLLLLVIGLLTSKHHIVTKTIKLKQPPEKIWETICDFQNQSSWRSELDRVERLPDKNGKEVWKEIYKNGDELPLETTESNPPHRLVRKIVNPDLPFSGTWEIEIRQEASGSSLSITERGEIQNPLFRGMFTLFFGYENTIVHYETELAKKFGESAVIE